MTVTYAKQDHLAYLRVSHRLLEGTPNDVYTRNRAFVRFNLAPYGLTLFQILSAKLRVNCIYLYAPPLSLRLRSGSISNNWGTTLDSSEADFISTNTNIESVVPVTALGSYEFDVNPANLILDGWTHFRISDKYEDCSNGEIYQQLNLSSQTDATPANRPLLIITLVPPVTEFMNFQASSPIDQTNREMNSAIQLTIDMNSIIKIEDITLDSLSPTTIELSSPIHLEAIELDSPKQNGE